MSIRDLDKAYDGWDELVKRDIKAGDKVDIVITVRGEFLGLNIDGSAHVKLDDRDEAGHFKTVFDMGSNPAVSARKVKTPPKSLEKVND